MTVRPGSLPNLRAGTSGTFQWSASAVPNTKPRDSIATTASGRPVRAAIARTASASPAGSASSGVMSLNRMPGLGKSGTSRISRARSVTPAGAMG